MWLFKFHNPEIKASEKPQMELVICPQCSL